MNVTFHSTYFDQYVALVREKRTSAGQIHHIVPRSLGGDDSSDNLVELSPKDHAIAHELLFKHFMFCVENMARAYISMLGGTYSNIRSAEDLPDEYNLKVQDAYNVMRKRNVYSLADMSIKRIGFFEAAPEGYVDFPQGTYKKIAIYNMRLKKIFRKWPADFAIPAGWKTSKQLSEEEKRTFSLKPDGSLVIKIQAYDPVSLDFGTFDKDSIPNGWNSLDISNPIQMLKDRKKVFERAASKNRFENVRAKLLRTATAIQEFLDSPGEKAVRENKDKCEYYGLYFYGGKYQSLNKWSKDIGISSGTLCRRIFKYGFSFEDAIVKMSPEEANAAINSQFPEGRIYQHSQKFLKKREESRKLKEQRKAQIRQKRNEREILLSGLLAEFNELGWARFMDKYGEIKGRNLFATLKYKFGDKCIRVRDNRVKLISYMGKTQSISKWEAELGISPWSVYELIHKGMTFQQAFDQLISKKQS